MLCGFIPATGDLITTALKKLVYTKTACYLHTIYAQSESGIIFMVQDDGNYSRENDIGQATSPQIKTQIQDQEGNIITTPHQLAGKNGLTLCAWVALQKSVTPAEFRTQITARLSPLLSHYKHPEYYCVVDHLEYTKRDKINRTHYQDLLTLQCANLIQPEHRLKS